MTSVRSQANLAISVVKITRLLEDSVQLGEIIVASVEEEITSQNKCKKRGKPLHKINPTDSQAEDYEDD